MLEKHTKGKVNLLDSLSSLFYPILVKSVDVRLDCNTNTNDGHYL